MGRPPSGEQIELRSGQQRATIVSVGAAIRSYTDGDRDVLDPFPVDARCDGGHGAVLVPWPNRLGGGRYRFGGADHQLPVTEADRGNAIHGLARWQRWQVLDRDPTSVVMGTAIAPQPGYPFDVEVTVTYRLGDDGLRVVTAAGNRGDAPCPYGVGHHPYLSPGVGPVDDATLHLDAAARILTDPVTLLPTATAPVAGTDFDLRSPTRIGARQLDDAYTALARDVDGQAWVRLTGIDGRTVELWADPRHHVIQLFTGDTLAPDRRRQGLAAEPMTCPANAFQTGDRLITLEPGESLTTTWGVRLGTRT